MLAGFFLGLFLLVVGVVGVAVLIVCITEVSKNSANMRLKPDLPAPCVSVDPEIRVRVEGILRDCVLSRLYFLRREEAKRVGRWGERDRLAWQRAKLEFVAEVVTPRVGPDGACMSKQEAIDLIDVIMDGANGDGPLPKTGIDYEAFCARSLTDAGWAVETTSITGDQGADLIASKQHLRVAVQCKFYNQPVGNKAVQEVLAAKAFYATAAAAVVTNSTYTGSAQAIAAAAKVLLLHHDQLPELDRLVATA